MDNQIEIFKSFDNKIELKVNLDKETVWLTQKQMGVLFNKARNTITEHIQNVFVEGELDEKVVSRDFRHTNDNHIQNIYSTKEFEENSIC